MPRQSINVEPAALLENVLGYQFQNKELLRQALTHKSAIMEQHPRSSTRDLTPLAFVGDAVLKYCAARYLFLNGQDDIVGNCARLSEGAKKVIVNPFLAGISKYKLHLENYLIRGNSHQTPSENMYADCMEAIFGAVALDCGTDRQEVVFRLIANLCFQPIEECLVPTQHTRFASYDNTEEDRQNLERIIRKSQKQLEAVLRRRSCWRTLGRLCLWLFIIVIGLAVVWYTFIISDGIFFMHNKPKGGWFDL